MTLQEMLAQRQRALATTEARRETARSALTTIRTAAEAEGRSTLTADEDTRVTELLAERRAADEAVATAEANVAAMQREVDAEAVVATRSDEVRDNAPRLTGGAQVTDPDVYARGGAASYFRDLHHATAYGRREASERLQRNDRAMAGNAEYRALTTTDGAGGDFVPPLWLVNEFIKLARPGRVTADAIAHQPLPAGTDTISLPRLASGTAVAAQATQNTAVQNTDATTSSVSASVETIAGQQVVSQQLLDQSPINMDEILLQDLAADYAVKLDQWVISNNATNKIGLLSAAGITVTYTDAAPTPAKLYSKVADGVQQIHTQRFMPGDKIVMHPRRWAWFLAALDSSNRPLVVPDAVAQNPMASGDGNQSAGRVGTLQGLPVYTDPNIPINLGAGTNEDRMIIMRSVDSILFESTPRAETFRETLANQLSVLLRFYAYCAIHASRYPKSLAVIGGTGLVTPTF